MVASSLERRLQPEKKLELIAIIESCALAGGKHFSAEEARLKPAQKMGEWCLATTS
jgi:hypothetical protein